MRSKILVAAAALIVLASAAYAQKIKVDVDRSFNFTTFKTYGWAKGQIAPKPTTSQAIKSAIESELNARGLTRNDDAPDFHIVVMAAADIDLHEVGPSWNNQRYRSWGGYGNPNALMNVTQGTLLIDLVETGNKISVWRGVAKEVFVDPPTGNPTKDAQKMENTVNKVVGKMFKKYPVSRGK